MTEHDLATGAIRTVRFTEYGEPGDVLHLETVAAPVPGPGRIRVAVHACGLTPADWALCHGLFPGQLPRGIGIEVSGTVDAVGDGTEDDVAVGDLVFGTADWRGAPIAGASDRAHPRSPGARHRRGYLRPAAACSRSGGDLLRARHGRTGQCPQRRPGRPGPQHIAGRRRAALEISLSGQARGKLLLLP
jgi:Alcohol dehydrogenase GroES-like domain